MRPAMKPMRVCPSSMRCRRRLERASVKLSHSTVGTSAGPVCGSIATTGTSVPTLTTVGVTMIAPSIRVPLSRESERRSHPSAAPCDPE